MSVGLPGRLDSCRFLLRFLPSFSSIYQAPVLRSAWPEPSSSLTTDPPVFVTSSVITVWFRDWTTLTKTTVVALALFVSTISPSQRQSAHGLDLDSATSVPSPVPVSVPVSVFLFYIHLHAIQRHPTLRIPNPRPALLNLEFFSQSRVSGPPACSLTMPFTMDNRV